MKTGTERKLSRMLKRAGIPKKARKRMLLQMAVPQRKGGLAPPDPKELFRDFPKDMDGPAF